jgi:folate-binding protein YgfZ
MSAFYLEQTRDEILVTGVDARKFLHSQLANDIASLTIGESRYSLLLEPTGKITSLVRVRCISEENFILDTESGLAEITSSRLLRFKIRIKCEIVTSSQGYFLFRSLTQEQHAKLVLSHSAVQAWRGAKLEVDAVAFDPKEILNIRQGSINEYELARVLAVWPIMGVDMTTDSTPSETGLTDVAVSFTKGCYPGQELVERMDSRGTAAPRSLRLIRADDGARVGEPVMLNGQEIGIYTSVCQDFALALIKRSADSSSIQIG